MNVGLALNSFHILISAYSQSDLFGKLIFLSLFFLSTLCWIVLIYKIQSMLHIKKLSIAAQLTLEKKRSTLLNVETSDLLSHNRREIPNPFISIFSSFKTKTVELLNKNHYFLSKTDPSATVYLSTDDLEAIESHVLTTISSEAKHLEKNLFILSTMITLAPFLGLLGTVWGILVTFAELNKGASLSSSSSVLGGISTALATTVLGLIIAIPALVSYNYLKQAIKKSASDMEDLLYRLLSAIELQYRKNQ